MEYRIIIDDMFSEGPFDTVQEAFSACPSGHESEVLLGNYPVGSFDEYHGEVLYLEDERRPAVREAMEYYITECAFAGARLREDGKVEVHMRHTSGWEESDEYPTFTPAEYAWLEWEGLVR